MKIKSIIAAVVAGVISLVAFGERDTAIYRGKLTSDMNANSNRIVGLATPIENGDAANKEYMDSAVSAATNGLRSVDGAARPLPRYLHALDFADSYTNEAAAYYRTRGDGKTDGGCSAARSGGFLYRNFDFPLDDRAEFVIKMSAGPNRFASVGVAQVGTNLTEKFVTSGKPSCCYKWLPGATVDGVNENGVVAEINVVDGEPAWHAGGDIHPLGAVRWALDHGTSAAMVASNLAARVAFPSGWAQNYHYMIADERETWIVENGTAYQVTNGVPAMTNFRLYGDPKDTTGEGQERYIALTNGANITSQWWTLTYTANGYRASDLPGITGEALTQLFNYWENNPRESHRGESFGDKVWWQSVHTSIYDITNRTLRIAVQEQDDWYTFAVPVTSGIKTETDPTVPSWAKQATPPEGMTENALVWTNNAVKTKSGAKTIGAADVGAIPTKNYLTFYDEAKQVVVYNAYWDEDIENVVGYEIALDSLYPAQYDAPRIRISKNKGSVSTEQVSLLPTELVSYISNPQGYYTAHLRFPQGNIDGTIALDSDLAPIQQTANAAQATANAAQNTANEAYAKASTALQEMREVEVLRNFPYLEDYTFSNEVNVVMKNAGGVTDPTPAVVMVNNMRSLQDPNMVYDVKAVYGTYQIKSTINNGGSVNETVMNFPYNQIGTIALQNYAALTAMLTDANTNETADCECISTNLCKLVEQPVSNLVVNVRDKFYDETLGVTWQKKIDNGFVTYEVISNEDIAP